MAVNDVGYRSWYKLSLLFWNTLSIEIIDESTMNFYVHGHKLLSCLDMSCFIKP